MSKALLVIDVQYDNFADSSMSDNESKQVIYKTNQLISHAKDSAMPVYVIEHISTNPLFPMFATGTKGAQTHAEIDTKETTVVIKHYPNSFRETGLQDMLEGDGITDIIMCGAMTHMCIDATVRAGSDLGYRVTLVHDACFTKDLEFEGRIVNAADVQVSYLAALGDGFCDVIDVNTFASER